MLESCCVQCLCKKGVMLQGVSMKTYLVYILKLSHRNVAL
jgi:hypothetical protein